MINGICYPCRLNQTKAASEYRIREKVNQNKLTSDQQMAHLLLDFKHVAIDPYPTQASTTFFMQVLIKFLFFAASASVSSSSAAVHAAHAALYSSKYVAKVL